MSWIKWFDDVGLEDIAEVGGTATSTNHRRRQRSSGFCGDGERLPGDVVIMTCRSHRQTVLWAV